MKRFAFLVTLSFCAEVDALVSQYQKNDILYKAGFLPLHTLNILQDEAKDLLSEMKAEKNSVAHSRVGCALRRGDVIYDIKVLHDFNDGEPQESSEDEDQYEKVRFCTGL